jgi:hypothetical protein
LPRRDGARDAADLRLRSTATDWHDGQISCSRENAVKEIVAVIAFVIPGWREAPGPESTTTIVSMDSGQPLSRLPE